MKTKNNTKALKCGLLAAGGLLGGTASADGLDLLPFALTGGTPNLDLRVRYEEMEVVPIFVPGVTHETGSSTVARLRVGYTTGKWNQLDAQAELEQLSQLGDDKAQSTRNYETTYPTIPDPEGGELNQAWIRYSGLPKTTLKYGRQRLVYDNARFIGNVIWRQNEQTYDGLTLVSSYLPKTTVNLAYLSNVNAFRSYRLDPANPGTALLSCTPTLPCSDDLDIEAQLVNIAITPLKTAALMTATPYLYRLDFAFDSSARRDTSTLGLRLTGAVPLNDAYKLSYALEYADQQDYADTPAAAMVDVDYSLIEPGIAHKSGVSAKLGLEVLGGNGTYGFQTPLSTVHAHNGWADLFVLTPAFGLERQYVQLGYTHRKLALTGVYHRFKSDEGSFDYGTEFDAQATYQLNEQFGIGAKYARFTGDYDGALTSLNAYKSDTTKSWLWIEYKF